jgi:hypothetical protein
MMMLKLFNQSKKTRHRTTCRNVLAVPSPTGDVGQESKPWAKEAKFASPWGLSAVKAGYDGSFTVKTGCGQARVRW